MKKLFAKGLQHHKSDWLSKRIKKEFGENKLNFRVWVKKLFSNLYLPGIKPIAIIAISIGLIPLITYSGKLLVWIGLGDWVLIPTITYLQESNHFQNLIAIHAGIGSIIFALFIMVAESIRDNQNKDTAPVLLKVSYLFPLTIAEIFAFLLFLFADGTWLTLVLISAIALTTVVSLLNTLNVLLDKPKFAQERMKFLRGYIEKNIRDELNERIGNNIFQKKLGSPDSKIKYKFFSGGEEYVIKSDESGVVTDIDMGALDEIVDLIEREANRILTQEFKIPTSNEETYELQKPQTDIRINVFKRYRQRISENNSELLSFDKSIVVEEDVIKKIEQKTYRAFKIDPGENIDDKLQLQLTQLRAQYTDAINDHKLIEIEELIQTYVGITNAYFECMKPFGGGFSFLQARREIASHLMGGWTQFSGLASDFQSLVTEALISGNEEIIRITANTPFKISRLAIQNHDHYLFQKFNYFPQWFYRLSKKDYISQEVKRYLFTRSWEFNDNLFVYYIKSKLVDPDIEDKKKQSLKDFTKSILLSYQSLMKDAFDQRDHEALNQYQQTVLDLIEFSHRYTHSLPDDIPFTRRQLEIPNLPIATRLKYKEHLAQLLIIKELEDYRMQIFFGLTSWVFDQYKSNQNDQEIKLMYESLVAVFNMSITEFTQIFIDTYSFESESELGGNNWFMVVEGKISTVWILEKIQWFYAVKALSLLAGVSEQEIERIELPYNEELASLVRENRDLIKVLDEISEHPDDWAFVLSTEEAGKVEVLKTLLRTAKEKQEADDLEELRRKPISKDKVDDFKNTFIHGFHENVGFRKLVEEFSTVENNFSSEQIEGKDRFGYNFVIDKTLFIEDEQVIFGDGGKEFGNNLANDESHALFNLLVAECEPIESAEFESKFESFPDLTQVILLMINGNPHHPFGKSSKISFEYVKYDQYLYRYEGKEIPVWDFYDSSEETKILILDKRKIEKLVQYSPLDEGDNKNYINDIFYMNIQSFSENEELMQEYLDDPPAWLTEKGDTEAQRLYLQEIVLIKILERFELVLNDEYQGYQIIIEDEQ